MKLSVPERRIKVIVLPKRKNVSIVVIRFLADAFFLTRMAILSYFHRQTPFLLTRETTLQHDMAQKIRFHFLLVEEWNF